MPEPSKQVMFCNSSLSNCINAQLSKTQTDYIALRLGTSIFYSACRLYKNAGIFLWKMCCLTFNCLGLYHVGVISSTSTFGVFSRNVLYKYTIYITLHYICGLCGLTVERSLAILKVAGSNLGRFASR